MEEEGEAERQRQTWKEACCGVQQCAGAKENPHLQCLLTVSKLGAPCPDVADRSVEEYGRPLARKGASKASCLRVLKGFFVRHEDLSAL